MLDGDTRILDHIDYEGYRYCYEKRPGKNGEICLATKDPKKYCNGFYSFSSKDPGNRMDAEGTAYCFLHYSGWGEIEDEEFHTLRKRLIDTIEAMETLVETRIKDLETKLDNND
jgi:hypothetical protein